MHRLYPLTDAISDRFYATSDRLSAMTHDPRRTLGALALILLALGVAVGSGADFSASSANPSNTFASGTLSMSNSKENLAILSAADMKPGDTATGTVDIGNTGSVDGDFALSRSALTDSDAINPLSAKLNLVVLDCGNFSAGTPTCEGTDTEVYSGTLAAMTGSEALGTYAGSEEHRYEFTVTFDSSAGNVYQEASSTATFQWDAA